MRIMQIFKVITLVVICFSLIFGNVANAAMLCCMAKNTPLTAEMKMDSKAEMPCHKTAEETDKKMQHNKSCANCKNCVSINALIVPQPIYGIKFANIIHSVPIIRFVSIEPSDIYSPPKQIS